MSFIRKLTEGVKDGLHRLRLTSNVQVQTSDGNTISGVAAGYCDEAIILGGESDDGDPVTIWIPIEAVTSVAILGNRPRSSGGYEDATDLPTSFDHERHRRNGKG